MSHFQDGFTVIAVLSLDAALVVGVYHFEAVDAGVETDLNAANCDKDDSQDNRQRQHASHCLKGIPSLVAKPSQAAAILPFLIGRLIHSNLMRYIYQ